MKNKYKIEGDMVRVFLHKNLEMLIDLEDLPKLMQYPGTVTTHIIWKAVYATINVKGQSPIPIHQIILDFPHCDIDHFHHNTLDNRKSELRLLTHRDNTKNRHGKNSNNTSGYRNVTHSKTVDRFLVVFQVNGKHKIFGSFKDVHEAGKLAKKLRKELYGEFAGND